jgi:5-methyltetrahydropteroyltriglutamate--homocysteine methyltransferase
MAIERTVIGSFPRTLIIRNYSVEDAIRYFVGLQLECGIDIITDGEQRGHMIEYYEQIPGLERTERSLKIAGRIKPIDDTDKFHKISDYKKVKSYLSSIDKDYVKVKIPFAGPMTLGFESAHEGLTHYQNIRDQRIYFDAADAISLLAQRAIELGAHVQIDEPGLSAGYTSPVFAKEVLNKLFNSLPQSAIDQNRVSLHTCGSVKKFGLYNELLDLDVGVLSLAFSGDDEKENLSIVTKNSLQDNNKKLGAGFILNTDTEDEQVTANRLKQIIVNVGAENIACVHPDCGFGETPIEKVQPILENMKKISDEFLFNRKF